MSKFRSLVENAIAETEIIKEAKIVFKQALFNLKAEYDIVPFNAEAISTKLDNDLDFQVDFLLKADIGGEYSPSNNLITLFFTASFDGLRYLEKHKKIDMQIDEILGILNTRYFVDSFIHEYQHYIYNKIYGNKKIGYTSYDSNSDAVKNLNYLTNADEYNAFSTSLLSSALSLAKHFFKQQKLTTEEFNTLYSKYRESLLSADQDNYYSLLQDQNLKDKLEKRLYKYLYYNFVEKGLNTNDKK